MVKIWEPLRPETPDENLTFLKLLYHSEDLEGTKEFEILDFNTPPPYEPGLDASMSFTKYLEFANSGYSAMLMAGGSHEGTIVYKGYCRAEEGIDRFFVVKSPLNEHNLAVIAQLYEQAYGKALEKAA